MGRAPSAAGHPGGHCSARAPTRPFGCPHRPVPGHVPGRPGVPAGQVDPWDGTAGGLHPGA
eukprot:7247452-Alexandrium_andersonii.AAC.1